VYNIRGTGSFDAYSGFASIGLPTLYQARQYLHAKCGTKSMTKPDADTKAALP
jgi:hypothetical protein